MKEISKEQEENYKHILQMYMDGWCKNCKDTVTVCLAYGKCKGKEKLKNG